MTRPLLTIAIPTYNRKKYLIKNLNFLISNSNSLIEILVIQNNSDKDNLININEYKNFKNIKIINNEYNIGANLNILKCIELSKSDWVWVLGDDDEPNINSLKNIIYDLQTLIDREIFCINYSTSIHLHNKSIILEDLNNFFICLNKQKSACSNILFISANIFNVREIKKNISFGHTYSESYAPHLAILFATIYKNKKKVMLSEKYIINSHDNDDILKWSRYQFAIKITKLLNLEFLKEIKDRKKLEKFLSNLASNPFNSYFLIYKNSYNKVDRLRNNQELFNAYKRFNKSIIIHLIFGVNNIFLSFDFFYKILIYLKDKYLKIQGK